MDLLLQARHSAGMPTCYNSFLIDGYLFQEHVWGILRYVIPIVLGQYKVYIVYIFTYTQYIPCKFGEIKCCSNLNLIPMLVEYFLE